METTYQTSHVMISQVVDLFYKNGSELANDLEVSLGRVDEESYWLGSFNRRLEDSALTKQIYEKESL